MKLDGKHDFLHQGEYKNTIFGLLPKDWTIVNLKDISIEKGTYGIGAAAVEYDRNLPRYLRITDIDDNGRLSHDDPKCLNDPDYVNYILKNNDIVFARTGNTTGKSYLYKPEDGLLVYAGFLIKFSINPLKADSRYVKFFTETNYYWQWVKIMSMRSGQPGINEREYGKLKLPIPCLLEQKKIADILETWDNAIELKEKLIEQKKEQKKGLMQKLLTGEVRLPGFKKEWQSLRIFEFCKTYSGGTPSRAVKEYYENGSIPWIKSGELNFRKVTNTEEFITEKGLKNSSAKLVEPETILLALYGATAGVVAISKIRASINQAVLAIIPNENCNKNYLFFYLENCMESVVKKYNQGGQPNLNADIIKKLAIKLPCLEEQKAIADLLNKIDLNIELLENELKELKRQKKGLMQLLLTGKVRVQV